MDKNVKYLFRVSDNLRKRLKAEAVKEGKTMSEFIEEMSENFFMEYVMTDDKKAAGPDRSVEILINFSGRMHKIYKEQSQQRGYTISELIRKAIWSEYPELMEEVNYGEIEI